MSIRKSFVTSAAALAFGLSLLAGCSSGGGGDGGGRSMGGSSAVYDAANVGDEAAVKTAVEGGEDVDARGRGGRTGLFIATYNGNVRLAKSLLAMGADPTIADDRGRTALMFAASKSYNDLLADMLAKTHGNLNAQDRNMGYSAAHWAATMGNAVGYGMLKKAGADVALTDKKGRTPEDLHQIIESRKGAAATTQPGM